MMVGQRVRRIYAGRFGDESGDFGTVESVDAGRLLVKWDGCRRSRIAVDAEGVRWARVLPGTERSDVPLLSARFKL